MAKTYLVLLRARPDGDRPWSSRKAIRLVPADTPEEAVREAHKMPPAYEVKDAWVIQVVGQPTVVDVKVPTPEWGDIRIAGEAK